MERSRAESTTALIGRAALTSAQMVRGSDYLALDCCCAATAAVGVPDKPMLKCQLSQLCQFQAVAINIHSFACLELQALRWASDAVKLHNVN